MTSPHKQRTAEIEAKPALAAAAIFAALWTGAAADRAAASGIAFGAIQTYATQGCASQALPLPSGEVFVSVNTCPAVPGAVAGIALFRPVSGPALSASCIARQPLNTTGTTFSPALLSLYNDRYDGQRYLAVAAEQAGALFYDVTWLKDACRIRNEVADQRLPRFANGDPSSFGVAVTPDAQQAFVANEYGPTFVNRVGATVVIAGQTQPFQARGSVGIVHLPAIFGGQPITAAQLLVGGNAIAGVALSHDGTRLYVTAEIAWPVTKAAGSQNPILQSSVCSQGHSASQRNGTLTVIDVARLLADTAAATKATPSGTTPVLVSPAIAGVDQVSLVQQSLTVAPVFQTHAILATVDAGCSPVRIVETADHSAVFVSARGDNRVLAFNPAALEAETAADTAGTSLIGSAGTGGVAPVGLGLLHHDRFLAVANSNRFGLPAPGNVTLLELSKAANGTVSATVVQTTDTNGVFPRDITVAPDDSTFYVTNYSSGNFLVIPTKVR